MVNDIEKDIKKKANSLKQGLSDLGRKLDEGDESNLLLWVIHNNLAVAHRPLRHHPKFGGRGRSIPPEARSTLFQIIRRWKSCSIRGIICLMHPKELKHYDNIDFGALNLIELYLKEGFEVRHIPWDDPAHRNITQGDFHRERMLISEKALKAFDELSKPVLLHCSAGIDRSSPVAAFIWKKKGGLACY